MSRFDSSLRQGQLVAGNLTLFYKLSTENKESRDTHHLAGWSFEGKQTLPLQAADVVAYEFFKFVTNEIIEKKKRNIRLSAKNLFRLHEIPFFRHFNQKSFEAFFQRWDGTI